MSITLDAVRQAHARIAPHIQFTPFVQSHTLSQQLGCELFIKFENLQFTASFKERGALNALLSSNAAAEQGVIAMSAGNHAQALAYHGERLGVPTTIVMPRSTPNAKVEATRVFGAEIFLEGAHFDETLRFTEQLAEERGLVLIHPFNDPLVIAGQGTVGLEMMETQPELDAVIVPIGGGGLMAGVATVVKALRPEVEVLGVQMSRFPGAHDGYYATASEAQAVTGTVAEGIAVKTPGDVTLPLVKAHVDSIHLVDEAAVEQAIFDLLEVEKTVAEGAGATPLALLRTHPELASGRRVGMVLTGGNIDMMVLSSVLQRGMVRSHRLVRMDVEIPDMPGALAQLTSLLGALDSNIVDIVHQRAFGGSSVRATVVELVLQLRGQEQRETVTRALNEAGYTVARE